MAEMASSGPSWIQEPGSSSGFPKWPKVLDHPLLFFFRPLAGSWWHICGMPVLQALAFTHYKTKWIPKCIWILIWKHKQNYHSFQDLKYTNNLHLEFLINFFPEKLHPRSTLGFCISIPFLLYRLIELNHTALLHLLLIIIFKVMFCEKFLTLFDKNALMFCVVVHSFLLLVSNFLFCVYIP